LDASILERYPEWQTLNSSGGNIRKSSKLIKNSGQKSIQSTATTTTATGSTTTLHQSGGSDYSQISSPTTTTMIGGGGNLGHATAMMGNLFDTICEDAAAIDHPMCQECTDKLLDCMDQQLHQLEEDCKEYKNLSDRLDATKDGHQHRPGTSSSEQHFDLNSLKSELLKLQGEEAGLQAELARLEVEEAELEKKLTREEDDLKKVTEDEEKLWKVHRDLNRQVHELSTEERSVRNQLRYANTQLEKLKTANVFNLTFHIWHSGHFGTINGFRLGRLPNETVDWSEINAAWGQTVLLLYSLSRKISLKFKRYELVPFGSHSYIRCVDDGNKELPLFCSGGYKFFWDTKFDSAMVAYLDCLQQFKEEIDKFGEIRLPYRMLKDKIEDNGNEYSVKIQFNSEERWTKAMKCMLTNLKWALACVSSLHP
jgi:beclin 1